MTWLPLWLSFQIAALATVLAVIAGTALSLLLRWRRLPARDLIDAVISAPLVLPPTVLGYYMLVMLGNTQRDRPRVGVGCSARRSCSRSPAR